MGLLGWLREPSHLLEGVVKSKSVAGMSVPPPKSCGVTAAGTAADWVFLATLVANKSDFLGDLGLVELPSGALRPHGEPPHLFEGVAYVLWEPKVVSDSP